MTTGAYPLDPLSPVGQLRVLVGDVAATNINTEAGTADYAVFSDEALEAALVTSGGSALRAAGNLYSALAAQYAQIGRSIRTDDLAISTLSRGADLLAIAKSFYDQAELADGASFDDFKIIPFAGRPSRGRIRPEATPWPL